MPLTHLPFPPFHAIHEIINMQLRRSHPLLAPLFKAGVVAAYAKAKAEKRRRTVGRATDNAPRAFSLISKEAHDLALAWQREDGRGGSRQNSHSDRDKRREEDPRAQLLSISHACLEKVPPPSPSPLAAIKEKPHYERPKEKGRREGT